MVRAQQSQAVWQFVATAVAERVRRQLEGKCPQHRLMRDRAQCQHHAPLLQGCQFTLQVAAAGFGFRRRRFVFRRQTLHRIGDATVFQLQSVAARRRHRFRGETEFVQRSIQQNAGGVAGERPAGAVGAVHAGRQSDRQQARVLIAERGHRPRVIVRMRVSNAREMTRQPRAQTAVGIEGGHGNAGTRPRAESSINSRARYSCRRRSPTFHASDVA